ncbi:MAG: segregation and condensation protein A [Planctomycetota bacterium]
MTEYRVNLEIYNGPLDLLLYLIRRDEVDIHDIPIARVTEQYLAYVNVLQELDPNMAGDFLVLAATLMEIKTRMLLPPTVAEGDEEGDNELDPRAELVRQLLQYKAFKDAAGDLEELADRQAQRFPRQPAIPDFDDDQKELEDVQVWDLVDAFSRLLEEIGKEPDRHEVIYDDTPVELHAVDIMDRLRRDGPTRFSRIFEGRTNRSEIVGLFLAILELVRQKKILTAQEGNFRDIYIQLNPNQSEDFDGGYFDYDGPPPEADATGDDTADGEASSPAEEAFPPADELHAVEGDPSEAIEQESQERFPQAAPGSGQPDDESAEDDGDELAEDEDEDGAAVYAEPLGDGVEGQYVADTTDDDKEDEDGDSRKTPGAGT